MGATSLTDLLSKLVCSKTKVEEELVLWPEAGGNVRVQRSDFFLYFLNFY